MRLLQPSTWLVVAWLLSVTLACSLQAKVPPSIPVTSTASVQIVLPLAAETRAAVPIESESTPTVTSFPTATAPPTIPPSLPPTAIPFTEPPGCLRPPDDYTRITIGNALLNQRTYWMLQRAQQLYGGTIPITGGAITQGSYNPSGVAASFGTHDGGGAVDLSVRNIPYDWSIKWQDIPRLIDALRLVGFAAFYRDEREGLPPHIHAIAIGDQELSPAAAAQLTGRYGYFRGFDGYPRPDGIPLTPRYGTLILCQWMLDLGYRDLRGEPLPAE